MAELVVAATVKIVFVWIEFVEFLLCRRKFQEVEDVSMLI